MYVILILVAITVGGHQHKFSYTSKTTYSQMICGKRAEYLAGQVARRIAKRIKPKNASVQHGCALTNTRSI